MSEVPEDEVDPAPTVGGTTDEVDAASRKEPAAAPIGIKPLPSTVPGGGRPPLDSSPMLKPQRGGPDGLGLGIDINELPGESSGAHGQDLAEVSRQVQRLGGKIDYKLQRIFPTNLPDGEMGWSDWIHLPATLASADDLEDDIRRKYGGGTYEVRMRSNDRQKPQEDFTRIRLSGPWIPQTYEGYQRFRMESIAMPSLAAGLPAGAPPPSGGAMAGGGPAAIPSAGDALTFAQNAMVMAAQREKEMEAVRATAKAGTDDLVLKLLLAKESKPDAPQPQRMGVTEILAAIGGALKLWTEITAPGKAAEDRRHQELVELLKAKSVDQSPSAAMTATKAILDTYQEYSKMEIGLKGKILEGWVQRELKGAGLEVSNGLMGAFESLIKDVGPDLARTFMSSVAQRMGGQTGQPAAPPPPGQPALPPPAPPAARPQPQPPPQQPRPPGKPMWDDEPPAAPPPPPASASPAGVPVSLEQQGRVVSLQRLDYLLSMLRAAMGPQWRPMPRGFWHDQQMAKAPDGSQIVAPSTSDVLEACPKSFRDRLVSAQKSPGPVLFGWLCEGVEVPEIVAVARDIDLACAADPEAAAYVRSLVDWEPWLYDEDLPPEEASPSPPHPIGDEPEPPAPESPEPPL